jgi:hypothetical protein
MPMASSRSASCRRAWLSSRSARAAQGRHHKRLALAAVLVVLLLPAVQQASGVLVTHTIPLNSGTSELHIRIGVDAKGAVTGIDWGDGRPSVAVADLTGDGRAAPGRHGPVAGDLDGDGYFSPVGLAPLRVPLECTASASARLTWLLRCGPSRDRDSTCFRR